MHLTASAPGEGPSELIPQPERQRVFTGMLRCHMCGQTCGVLEASDSRLVAWQRLHCPRCGSGSLFVDELEIVSRRIEVPLNLFFEKPRRGRPPRWLVERRARNEAV